MKSASNNWSEEELRILTDLWSANKTAQEIADELGNKTRNAVLGKVHRLKLPARCTRPDVTARIAKKPKKEKPPVSRETDRIAQMIDTPPANLVSLLDLRTGQCAWPFGDPKEPGFGFCGQRCKSGSSFCEGHHRRSFQTTRRPDADEDRLRKILAVVR